jgi:hypothetical protein
MEVVVDKIGVAHCLRHRLLSVERQFSDYPNKYTAWNRQLCYLKCIKRPTDSKKKRRIVLQTASIIHHSNQLSAANPVMCGKWSFQFIAIQRNSKIMSSRLFFSISRFSVLAKYFSAETCLGRVELIKGVRSSL